MSDLRLCLAQINPTVGDLDGNVALIRTWAAKAAEVGAHLVAFPEMMITGYPVEDLALRASFVQASRTALAELAIDLAEDGLGDLTVVVGYLDREDADGDQQIDPDKVGKPKGSPQNCAAVIRGGEVIARYAKHHLPNYGVFDEFRIFVPGNEPCIVEVSGARVSLAICEDLWQEGGPVADTAAAGADLLLALNGSPYERNKDDVRRDLVTRRAAQAGCALAYVNMVGGQDDLIFDGDSIVVSASGEVLARARQFSESLVTVDLPIATFTGKAPTQPLPSPSIAEPLDGIAEVYEGLVLGLRDYVRKNGFSSVVLGLSGGIDSALVATIAADAVGPAHVAGISMPSEYSSDHSRDDAADLAKRIGLDYRVVPIAPMVQSFLDALGLTGIAEENLQARVRGVILMGLSNAENRLCLTTGNKSELAVGYTTIYGDSVGGFNPLKDVPKTLVWQLARWRNASAEGSGGIAPIPQNSITKAPSAELRPGQTDQDSLPPYEVLDEVLEAYVGQAHGRGELLADGFEATTVDGVVTLVDRAEWKRRQSAPGPKISAVAFGRDRRLPITSRWRENKDRSRS